MLRFIFSVFLFLFSAVSFGIDWVYQCGSSLSEDCLMQGEYQDVNFGLTVGFGRSNNANVFLIETNKRINIDKVEILSKVDGISHSSLKVSSLKSNGSEAFFILVGNVSFIENVFSERSNYNLVLKSNDGSKQVIPTEIIDLKSAIKGLGDKFYSKLNYPSEDFIKESNEHFKQFSGVSVDEFVKFGSVFLSRNRSDYSVTIFYNYKLKDNYGDEFESNLANHYNKSVDEIIEQMCFKQSKIINQYDGIRELRISISLQGNNKNIFSTIKRCN